MNKHIADPLAYLYEELGPAEMEQARRHLATCPECRQQAAAILETVKAYRNAPRPAVPTGLADRTARAALAQAARLEPAPAAVASIADSSDAAETAKAAASEPDQDELEYIAQSRPARLGWREWFFHPAWTVAAGVIFVCAILIHVSPRQNRWLNQHQAEITMLEPPAAPPRPVETQSARLRLPAPLQRHDAEIPVPIPEPQPPAIAMAEAYESPSAPSAAPATATGAVAEPPPPAVAMAMPDAGGLADRGAGMETARAAISDDAAPASPRQPTSVASLFAGAQRGQPKQARIIEQEPTEPEPESIATVAAPKPALAAAPAEPVAAAPIEMYSVDAYAGAANFAESAAAAIAPGTEVWTRDDSATGEPAETDLLMLESLPAPVIIERPAPVDLSRTVEELVFLIGLQSGQRSFAEAMESIDILRKVDEKKADEMLALLLEMEKAEAEAENVIGDDDPAAPVSEPEPEQESLPQPVPDPVTEPAGITVETVIETPESIAEVPEINAEPVSDPPASLPVPTPAPTPTETPVVVVPPLPPMPTHQPSAFLQDAIRSGAPQRRRNPFSSDPYIRGD